MLRAADKLPPTMSHHLGRSFPINGAQQQPVSWPPTLKPPQAPASRQPAAHPRHTFTGCAARTAPCSTCRTCG